MIYRPVTIQESEQLWELMNQLDYETKYMLYEPGEREKKLDMIESLIQGTVNGNNFLLVAESDNKLVGYIAAQKESLKRVAHCAYVAVGILQDYQGKGIGTNFFQHLEKWAKEKDVKRLELTVVCDNEIAVHLYKKSGYKIEGIKENGIFIDGKYLNEYYMAKIL